MKILNNRRVKVFLFILVALCLNLLTVLCADFDIKGKLNLQYTIQSETPDHYQVFYGEDNKWMEEKSIKILYSNLGNKEVMTYELPSDIRMIRMDFGENEGPVYLSNVSIQYLWNKEDLTSKLQNDYLTSYDIEEMSSNGDEIIINRSGKDAYIELDLSDVLVESWFQIEHFMNMLFKVLACIALNVVLVIFVRKRRVISSLLKEVYANKQLMWNLSKNDFKTKYAGSYLGIIWAFIQPVVTVLIYWFVFQVGFRSAPIDDFPFVLWLVAGIVPWFFFSEALMNATYSMVEYSYLVKKVVFKISILPIVKILSAFFVHIFFVIFAIGLFAIYGYMPTLYTLQVFYYTICVFVLVLGLSYATSAIMIFFKDLGQLIGILLQVGVWMTPIMWSYNMIPIKYQWVFKLNPMYYIVEGYRDSLINHVWFWERFNQTIYFWVVAGAMFGIGTLIFRRLKIHFADVL